MMKTKEYLKMVEIAQDGIARAKELNDREDFDYWYESQKYWTDALRASIQRDREKCDEN